MSKKILHDSFLWKASFVNAYCNNPAWLGSPRPIIEWLEKNPPLWLTAPVKEQVESREVFEPVSVEDELPTKGTYTLTESKLKKILLDAFIHGIEVEAGATNKSFEVWEKEKLIELGKNNVAGLLINQK